MNLSSLSGMRAGDLMMAVAADNTANWLTPGYHAEQVDLVSAITGGVAAGVSRSPDEGVDLGEQAVGQIEGSLLYQANARVIQARRETEQSLFDMLA